MRKQRHIPEGGALVEVTCRTVNEQFLLTPDQGFNEIVVGVVARAKRRYPLKLCGLKVLSDHYHLLVHVEDAQVLARFMGYLNANLAKEVDRKRGRRGAVWSRRYEGIQVSQEPAAQVGRMVYLLANGVKEGLVERLRDWPGVDCVRAIVDGEPLTGTWFDRTKEHAARLRGEDFDRLKYATPETLTFDPLPCWAHLSPEAYRERIRELVDQIDAEAAAQRAATGITPPGPEAIRRQNPFDRPNRPKRSPAPLFHAATKAARWAMWEVYATFVAAFREAAEKLKRGDLTVAFPPGSFPPPRQFVPA
jgi:REP element-mobilizing transposase RayT